MSDGWKLATLKRRRAHLAERLEHIRADGMMHHRATKHDQREFEALDWAINMLDTDPCESSCA